MKQVAWNDDYEHEVNRFECGRMGVFFQFDFIKNVRYRYQ